MPRSSSRFCTLMGIKGRPRTTARRGARVAVMCLLSLFALFASPALGEGDMPSDDLDPGRVRVVLTAGEFSIFKDEDGLDVVTMDGFASTTSPGDPLLVHQVYNLLIPPEAIGSDLKIEIVSAEVEVLDGTYDIRPVGPLVPASGEFPAVIPIEYWGEDKNVSDGRNLDVYERDANYPENYLELLPYSEMRKWKFARLDFVPLQHNPASKRLTLIRSVAVDVAYSISPEAMERDLAEDTVMDDVARDLFINYDEAKAWYGREYQGAEVEPLAIYDYVIITTDAIVAQSSRLRTFISHKENLGYSVLVVTEADFEGLVGDPPNHRAEKIRRWLKNNYASMGIKYVLLIGDPHPYESGEGDIPMKMCYPRYSDTYPEAPTDYFYADLTGDWDINGDQIYGQWGVDYPVSGGVDFTPEVYVGRIPVYDSDYATLDRILLKIIEYETSSDTDWRKSALLPMSFSDSKTDGARLGEQMKDVYLDPNGYSYWRMYQQGSIGSCANSIYPSDEELHGDTVVRNRWAAGDYGIVCWWGHGGETYAGIGYKDCSDGYLFRSSYSPYLDDSHPSFTYHCSCLNANPETSNNLAYSVLKQGGISTISATRVSWYYPGRSYFDGSPCNAGLGYEYVKRLVVQKLPGGDALYLAKESVYPGFASATTMNWYVFNLYGDPSVSLENPPAPEPTVDMRTASWQRPRQ